MEISLDVDEVTMKITELAEDILPKKLQDALEEACLIVENDAKTRCPADTGQLRSSIQHRVIGNEGEVFTNVSYAMYVEFGTGIYAEAGNGRQTPWSYQDAKGNWHTTRGMTAQPFLRPALDSNRAEIGQCFEGLL